MREDKGLFELDQLAGSETLEVFRRFVLGRQEYKTLKETEEELWKEIETRLGNKAKLMELYDDLDALDKGLYETVGFVAGLRTAFRLLSVICNPQPLIFPAWGESFEESCKGILERMKQVLDGKTA